VLVLQHTRSAFLAAASAFVASASSAQALAAPAGVASLEATADPDTPALVSSAQALQRLRAGNARFVAGTMQHSDQTPARRRAVAPKQQPFACVLDCADSRVPPEVVFDQGLGDLFVCRVAGNIADDAVTGSIEYAVEHFHTPLVVVLGHQRCGAVAATLDTITSGVLPPASIATLVRAILPIAKAVPQGPDWFARVIDANARAAAATLALSPILHHAIAAGKLQVVAAHYSLDSGNVTVL
jgi:carbonic anhydrase